MNRAISDRRRIVQNSMFLYMRTVLVTAITLVSYRVIIRVLGLSDYGIYTAVGGIIGVMAFLKAALDTAASRFFSFEIGKDNKNKLEKLFSSVVSAHIVLGLFIIICCETIGLWFVENRFIIPETRHEAALACYHFSVAICFLNILKVPYSASIISHEEMKVYSFVSVVDVTLKLILLYAMTYSTIDRLIMYVSFEFIIEIGLLFYYFYYCTRYYDECRYTFSIDFKALKEILSYTMWNLLSNISNSLKSNGGVVLLNIFFTPPIVASYAITNSVNAFSMQVIANVRTATSPQIIKRLASGDIRGSKYLLLKSTQITFYILLLVCLPLFFLAEPVIKIWLDYIPPYSVPFFKLALITGLVSVYNSCFYAAIYAKGRIKENAISLSIISLMILPICYILFKNNYSPISLAVVSLIVTCVLSFIQKPVILHYIVGYSWQEILSVFFSTLKVALFALLLPFVVYSTLFSTINNIIIQSSLFLLLSYICTILSIWFWGFDVETRSYITNALYKRFNTTET